METMNQATVAGRLILSKILIVLIGLAPQPAFACKKFSIWHYPRPQRCFTALAPLPLLHVKHAAFEGQTQERIVTKPERIDILMPPIDFVPCPDGDERLQGIAKLHAIMDAPPP